MVLHRVLQRRQSSCPHQQVKYLLRRGRARGQRCKFLGGIPVSGCGMAFFCVLLVLKANRGEAWLWLWIWWIQFPSSLCFARTLIAWTFDSARRHGSGMQPRRKTLVAVVGRWGRLWQGVEEVIPAAHGFRGGRLKSIVIWNCDVLFGGGKLKDEKTSQRIFDLEWRITASKKWDSLSIGHDIT